MIRNICFISLFILSIYPIVFAQDLIENNSDFEAFTINIQFEKIGNYSFSSIYNERTEDIYLPLEALFDLLKIIKNTSADGHVISGFMEGNNKPYTIDLINRKLTFNTIEHELIDKDFVFDNGMLMLNLNLFNSVFEFDVDFSFRNLTATFKANFEPPVLRFERLELIRKALRSNQFNIETDTTLLRRYHWFKAGMLDWTFTGNQYTNGLGENRFNLGFGAEVLGGQTDIFLNYSDKYGCNINQQRYQWRWVDNHPNYINQVQLGRIYNQSISSLLYPVDGFMVTNASSTLRKAIGEYLISDMTQPDWIVELYINKVLIDYTIANASGFYSFKIPIVYGTSMITLRFYGPNGEEHLEEKVIHTPYNFLPRNRLEYSVSGGVLLDHCLSQYSLTRVNYGVTRWLTIGAGFEYLSSIRNNSSIIPFANVSIQVLPKLILTSEYAHHVLTKAKLNYSMLKDVALEIYYAHYTPGQTAIIYNYREERNINLSFPYKLKGLNGYARAAFRQYLYTNFGFTAGEAAFSSNYLNFSANFGNYINYTSTGSMNIYSHLALGWRINVGLNARVITQYSYTQSKVSSCKFELEKRVFDRGYLSLAYENNLPNHFRSLHFSFRFDLECMSSYFSTNFMNNKTQFSESVRGSLAFGSGNRYVHADKRNAVGSSGIAVVPYVDVNHNDRFDDGEPRVSKLRVLCSGGHIIANRKDSIFRVVGLEPFVEYHLTLSELDFENLSWQIACKKLNVTTDPNQFKHVEVSIKPMGEVNGVVVNRQKSPMGRILLHIKNDKCEIIKEVITESDGYFSYLGLKPDHYTIEVDPKQLVRINYTARPIPFVIKQEVDGDIVDVGNIILDDLIDTIDNSVLNSLHD